MNKHDKIYIAGHRGLVGSSLLKTFKEAGYTNIVAKTHRELDLTDQPAVREFFADQLPDYVVLAAAKVGGILANDTFKADFIYQNLMIASNIIEAAHKTKVKKLLFLGSNCNYPKKCPQPMKEEHLLTGPLEPTNEPYAVAKIAGIKLCQSFYHQHGCNFFSAMPANLYGPGDNFDLMSSHVMPAMIRKFEDAKPELPVTLWGTGSPRREFLYVDDLAEACLELMEKVDASQLPHGIVNIGCGYDYSLREAAATVQKVIGHTGDVFWDSSKPDGAPCKLLDSSLMLNLCGWKAPTGLEQGIGNTVRSLRRLKS